MDVYQMQLTKVGPGLRERVTRYLAGQHHRATVNRLRQYREMLEAGMTPEPWIALEAPVLTVLADVCAALHLTPAEQIEVLGNNGQQAQMDILEEPVLPQKQLNVRQRQALIQVQAQGYISNGDLQRVYPDVTSETLRLDLADLVQRGLLRRQGRCRGTRYTAAV